MSATPVMATSSPTKDNSATYVSSASENFKKEMPEYILQTDRISRVGELRASLDKDAPNGYSITLVKVKEVKNLEEILQRLKTYTEQNYQKNKMSDIYRLQAYENGEADPEGFKPFTFRLYAGPAYEGKLITFSLIGQDGGIYDTQARVKNGVASVLVKQAGYLRVIYPD